MLRPTWSSPSWLSRITSFGSHVMTHLVTMNTPTSSTSSNLEPRHSHQSFFQNEFPPTFVSSFDSLIIPSWTPSLKEPHDPFPRLLSLPSWELYVFNSSSKSASIMLSTSSSSMEFLECKFEHIDTSLQEICLLHILLKSSCLIASYRTNKDVSTFCKTSLFMPKVITSNRRPKILRCTSWAKEFSLIWQKLYTRSGGQCSTQITHSYWCKSWNQLQGLNYTRSQGWNRKNLFNLPQVTNKCRTLWYWPQGWRKGYHQIWEANLQPLWPML